MASSIQEFDKTIASINKESDKKEEMSMMMAPFENWDSFLAPAPVTIALLGQLILVSADTDFSLQDKRNEIRFEFLKYPDSFRACLVQVSNSGWNAFNKARTCMDQIRLYSGNVDGYVRRAVKFLIAGSPQEIELMLPNALKSIDNIADKCVMLARSMEEEFVLVMKMVAELLEACTRAKGQYAEELRETEIAIQVAEENRRAIEGDLIGLAATDAPPRQAKQEIPEVNQEDEGLVKSAVQNARFKIETAKQNLKETRRMYDKSCQEADEKMKRMGEFLAQLVEFNPKKIDLEIIRAMLVKGIHALGELREQWGKLVCFFIQGIDLQDYPVSTALQSSLKEFSATSSNQMKLTGAGLAMSDTIRDVLFEQAFKANQIAYVVNSISTVYVEASDQHLMDRIAGLGKLVALDAEKDKREIMLKREELNSGCKEAQEAIKRMAEKKKKEILIAFDKRIGRIEQEVEAKMPPLPEAEVKEIQAQTKAAMATSKGKAAIDQEVDDSACFCCIVN